MKLVIANAFSINMLTGSTNLVFKQLTTENVTSILESADTVTSIIGHADTAAVVSDTLGIDVPANRVSYEFTDADTLLVAQYSGPRLAEGTTKLPEGASIQFWMVSVA